MSFVDFLHITIEERVTIVENQVVEIEEDITGLGVDLSELEGDVNFMFDETVIQDKRIFTLDQKVNAINMQLVAIDDELESEFVFCY